MECGPLSAGQAIPRPARPGPALAGRSRRPHKVRRPVGLLLKTPVPPAAEQEERGRREAHAVRSTGHANHNDQPRARETGDQRWGWHVRQLCKRRVLLRQDDGRAGSDRSSGCRQRREASLKAVGGCTEREQSRDAHADLATRGGKTRTPLIFVSHISQCAAPRRQHTDVGHDESR